MKNEIQFKFKELKVWQKALDFVDQVINISESTKVYSRHYRLTEQIESSSASIAQNIASMLKGLINTWHKTK